jgi:hypothetical protein
MMVVFAAFIITSASASYTITNLNTTVVLYKNTSAAVTEIFNISVSNQSVSQYVGSRASLNLTLSQWQSVVGPALTEYILNPKSAATNLRLLPGPLIRSGNYGGRALIVINYEVANVTTVNRTGPRILQYAFEPSVFNFEHGQSGEILPQGTSLSIILPSSSQLESVYPIPDSPQIAFGSDNRITNVSRLTWDTGEPLSKFELGFQVNESLQEEVQTFFANIYDALGIFFYIIIIIAILLIIAYAYFRASRSER